LAQFRELQVFSQFSSDLDRSTLDMLHYSSRLVEILKQRNGAPLSTPHQVGILYAMSRGMLSHTIDMTKLLKFKQEFPSYMDHFAARAGLNIEKSGELTRQDEQALIDAVNRWLTDNGEPEALV